MSLNISHTLNFSETFPFYENTSYLAYEKGTSYTPPSRGSSTSYDCNRINVTTFFTVMTLIELPINMLLFKVLLKDSRLDLPRHKILLSLAISDYFQIAFITLLQFIGTASNLKTTNRACQVVRKTMEVTVVVTTIATSGSILALAIERYVACIHCFRAHEIVSEKRVKRAVVGIWIFGFICSVCDKERYQANFLQVAFPLTRAFKILYTIVILTSSAMLLFIQFRLYKESHRLMKVRPDTSNNFSSSAEANNMRRNQLKVSFIASIVIVMYVICMCPLAFYIVATEIQQNQEATLDIRQTVIGLNQINTFADPFVYGVGMSDTRKAMIREMQHLKQRFLNWLSAFLNQEA